MNPFYGSLEIIWKNPKYVHINEAKLWEAILRITKEDLKIPNWRMPVYYPEDDENFVQFIGIQNSINFAFTDFETKRKFKIEYKDAEWRGAMGMVGSLMRAIEDGFPVFDAKFLSKISEKKMEYIFRSIPDYPIPMLGDRTKIFQEVGKVLLKKYDGSFWNIFKDAGFKAFGPYGIVNQLRTNFSSFNDVGPYNIYLMDGTYALHFHKRSQLLVMIYQGRALDSGRKLPLIGDIDDLGAIADYEVPKVLEHLGILKYNKVLKEKILRQDIIEQDSLEEQEIRAMTVLAMKRLLEEINKLRKDKINMCHLDYRIWKMGTDGVDLSPHHLTPTIFY